MRNSPGVLASGVALSPGVGAAADKAYAVVVKALDNPSFDLVRDDLPAKYLALKEDRSHAQVGQRSYEMGYRAMFVMHDPVNGKTVAPTVYAGLGTCPAETVETCPKK